MGEGWWFKDRQNRWPYTLRRLAFFADCSPDQLETVGRFLTAVTIQPGTTVMREQTYGTEFVIIEDGLVGVHQGRDFEARLLSVLGSGDFVGEIALLERTPRSATVTALTEVRAFVSTPSEFRGLLAWAPSLEEKVVEADLARCAANLLGAA